MTGFYITITFAYIMLGYFSVDLYNMLNEHVYITRPARIVTRLLILIFWPIYVLFTSVWLFSRWTMVGMKDTFKSIYKTLLG